ncbi:putative proteasome component (PCI) domain, tetratricopeptide-like helical domain-containing protein [Balamuthia mandrillaris]
MAEKYKQAFEQALAKQEAEPEEAIALYQGLIDKGGEEESEEVHKVKEQAIYKLGELYAKRGEANELHNLLTRIRPFFNAVAKAKTAKIVRSLIDLVARIPDTVSLQIELCKECIEWAKEEQRTFLRQRIEARLSSLYLETEQYTLALKLLTSLLREIKRFDDKLLLVEIQLIESQVQHKLLNIPKAKASLTAARTAANSIYCPPLLQAQIDMQAGTLHAEEKDYKTAYSYFYEAFEGFTSITSNDPSVDQGAILALKYMLLCKIMLNSVADVNQIMSGKNALKYAGREMEAMRAVATAHKNRSLKAFEQAKNEYAQELGKDIIVQRHLAELEDTLLEQNLSRIIEPFSCVEINHVASLIDLPVASVEKKLSQMILDKKLLGILDQGADTLIVFDEPSADGTYPAALETVQHMGKVVDSLYEKALKLNI